MSKKHYPELVAVADEAYGDGLVKQAADLDESPGDTLALFIARELNCACCETLSDSLREGVRMMEKARDELDDVAEALTGRLADAERNGE